jgi:hypothetical protein
MKTKKFASIALLSLPCVLVFLAIACNPKRPTVRDDAQAPLIEIGESLLELQEAGY